MIEIVGHSRAFQELLLTVSRVSQSNCTLLIEGETGVGKELFARRIHEAGRRKEQPFVLVDCAARSGHLAQALQKPGVAQTDKGTLFLQEIGDLALELQLVLLRALQEQTAPNTTGSFEKIHFRVIAATNCDLRRQVAAGHFRQDLYGLLNVVTLRVPPLRERRDDIPALAAYFLRRYQPQGKHLKFSRAAEKALVNHSWPGNVRELENSVHSAAILSAKNTIRPEDLLAFTVRSSGVATRATRLWGHMDREEILKAMLVTGGDRKLAAKLLGIGRTTLYRKLGSHRLSGGDETC
jgi:DNA-binding NtrC family response regulator